MKNFKDITVAVAGTGYVGLSIARYCLSTIMSHQ